MSRRVLVVDDEPRITDIVVQSAQIAGYNTSASSNSQDALNMISEALSGGKPYEIIFCDFAMDGLTGLDILRKTREFYKASGSKTPYHVAMTGGSEGMNGLEEYLDLADRVVEKPFRLARISAALNAAERYFS